MNFILSIFLCFALAFSGPAGLPAEPETATTWTIRNVTIYSGEEFFTLNPEARITTAAGQDKVALHFELENDGKALLPVSAEITPDALTFALKGGERAYTLSNAEFLEICGLDEEDVRILEVCGDLLTSYGGLLGLAYGDEEQMTAYGQAMIDATLDACGSEFTPAEIEFVPCAA